MILSVNREEAEDFVYSSYLKAEKYQAYGAKDALKRRPDLTRDLIHAKTGTPAVVVTGSKGKGSVATMISQVLQTRYRVGLLTSPHLVDFCERFRVDGKPISDEDFARYMTQIRPEIEAIASGVPEGVCVSPMGIQAALALTYFSARDCDFDVFECGKGARWDDVNNVAHAYAVINSIFLEHTRELGHSVEAIAEDKVHVITGEQKCVYVADQAPEVRRVLERRAAEFGTALKIYGRDFRAEHVRFTPSGMLFDVVVGEAEFRELCIPLLGEHQARNCALAMALSVDVLGRLDIEKVRAKLAGLEWPGRMEVISESPFMMLDACINPASCVHVKEVVRQLGLGSLVVVIGIPQDKDYVGVAREMRAIADDIILTKSQNAHYVFSEEQSVRLEEEGIPNSWADSTSEALRQAKELGDNILILGTTSVVAEVKQLQLSGLL